jgi:hypothetical protein
MFTFTLIFFGLIVLALLVGIGLGVLVDEILYRQETRR